MDCLLLYFYTGNVAEPYGRDSALSAAIKIFTEENYGGLSLDQALKLLADQTSHNDAMTDSSMNNTNETPSQKELSSKKSRDESQIICHIETDMSNSQYTDRVCPKFDQMEASRDQDDGTVVTCDSPISPLEKRSSITDDCDHFAEQNKQQTHFKFEIARTLCPVKKAYMKSHVKLPRKPPFLCPCQNCGKIFESHQRLRSHYRHTHGEKKYKCDLCPLRFLYPKDLKSHIRTHTGEKPFICEICGKGFAQSCTLKIHQKVHEKSTDDVVFRPCPECSRKYCLKDRDKNVDYLNDFSADLSSCICPNSNCAKKFSSVKCLKNHLKNDVCNPNKFHCGLCFMKFDDNIQLRYHVGTLHCVHKKRKKVKPENKESVSHEMSFPTDYNLPTSLPTGFENLVDTSPMLCNVEEISGLLQLSEEVVIKGDE